MSVLRYGHGDKVGYMALKPVLIWCCVYFHLKKPFLKNGMCLQPLSDILWRVSCRLKIQLLQAQTELGLDQQQQYIALLPGSRRGEIERLGPLVLDAANILTQKYPELYLSDSCD